MNKIFITLILIIACIPNLYSEEEFVTLEPEIEITNANVLNNTVEFEDASEASESELRAVTGANTDGIESGSFITEVYTIEEDSNLSLENAKRIRLLESELVKIQNKKNINLPKAVKPFTDKNGNSYKIETDAEGNRFIVGKDGVRRLVKKDVNGREYFLDKNGNKVYLDGKISPKSINKKDLEPLTNGDVLFTDKNGNSYKIETDAEGNRFIVGKDGVRRLVKKDVNGREYFLDENGNKVYLDEGKISIVDKDGVPRKILEDENGKKYYIDENGQKVYIDELTKTFTDKNGTSYKIETDAEGNRFVVGKDGVKRIVKTDANGREYFLDENGNKVYLDEGVVLIYDEEGSPKEVLTDPNGREFYIDKNGNKVYLDGSLHKKILADKKLDVARKKASEEQKTNDTLSAEKTPLITFSKEKISDEEKNRLFMKTMAMEDAVSIFEYVHKMEQQLKENGKTEVGTAQEIPELSTYLAQYEKEHNRTTSSDSNNSDNREFRIQAICEVGIEKEISSTSSMLETYCKSSKIGAFILLSELTITTDESIPILAATPLDLTSSIAGVASDAYTIVGDKNYLLNNYTKNKNIATWANTRRLEKWMAANGKSAYDVGSKTMEQYKAVLAESYKKESVETDAQGEKTRTIVGEQPELVTFLTPAAIDLGLALIKNGIDAYQKDSPNLYEIKKGTRLKLYVTIKKEVE